MSPRILVPLDGSSFSLAALPWAFALSDAWEAEVEIANVHEMPPAPELGYLSVEVAEAWSDAYLERMAERIRAETGRQVTQTVLGGSPADALERHARSGGIDLVVMATHGRGPLTRAWLGGVADALMRHTPVPLLLVRPADDPTDDDALAPTPRPERVLVPLDGSPVAEAALPEALRLVELFGSALELVRVFPYPESVGSSYLPHTIQENARLLEEGKAAAREYLERKAAALACEGVTVAAEVLVDHRPASGILHHAEGCGADMVVMATHGYGGVRRALLGSVTDKVVRGSTVPVLVVRPDAR